ncbi:MAG: histidine triad nucleotide-binding protein [Tissierellia bacterium]|nr:histidine triad nucleotide-binding protein [Tissierellia bacterium]
MDCLFCKIIEGSIPADVVYEDDHVLAFKDINPISPLHVLFVPKVHFVDLSDSYEKEEELLYVFKAIRNYVAEENLNDKGYRLVINAGELGQQTVAHLHVHLISGRQLSWPAG